MGVDIHVFIEQNVSENDVWVPIEMYTLYMKELDIESPKIELEAFEGVDHSLFDILQQEVPQRGVPRNPSRIFQEIWKSYKDSCSGYGCNYILLSELFEFFKKEESRALMDTLINIPNVDFSTRYTCEILYPFINGIFNYICTLNSHGYGYPQLQTENLDTYRIIYFFDR